MISCQGFITVNLCLVGLEPRALSKEVVLIGNECQHASVMNTSKNKLISSGNYTARVVVNKAYIEDEVIGKWWGVARRYKESSTVL